MKRHAFRGLTGLALLAAGIGAFWPIQRGAVTGGLWMDALHLPAAVLLMYWLSWFGSNRHPSTNNPQVIQRNVDANQYPFEPHSTIDCPSTVAQPSSLFWSKYWQPLFGLFLLAALEVLQNIVGRSAQWSDFLHGSLGILLFYSARYLPWIGRTVMWLLCLLIASRGLLGYWLYQQQLRDMSPHLITQPWLDTTFGWHPITQSTIRQQADVAGHLTFIVMLNGTHYQGLEWHNPEQDFSAVTELCFSALGTQAMRLSVRIDDMNSTDYHSRYHSTVSIGTNWQRFCLDINQLPTPNRRTLDKSALTSIYIFTKPERTSLASHSFSLRNLTIWPG